MARLNEPMVSADPLEALRERYRNQNRHIARINSTQSLKIRSLENECARLLSENLELRSHVLRLQAELEGSQAKRIADHALEIKEKMEAQLVEWGTMLASLGHEPIPKNRSPRAAKKPRIQRASMSRSGTSDWRRRETLSSMQELEAAALQEGRLPPVWENKTYPRETLNPDEILALRSEADDSTDSLDIGPPPVSRFIEEDTAKLDLATLTNLLKPALCESESSGAEDVAVKSAIKRQVPASTTKTGDVSREGTKEDQTESNRVSESSAASQATAAKSSLKRKTREEDEREKEMLARTQLLANITLKAQLENKVGGKERPISRPMKELPLKKTDGQPKNSLGPPRRPLGSKNSNEVLGSPKKMKSGGDKLKPSSKDEDTPKNNQNLKKEPAGVEIPAPSSPLPVARMDVEPESLSTEPDLAIPLSPEPMPPSQEVMDTPPPVDITSNGETARGSRRARAAVSYAEPNLRDKMRRPNTKQLFDAVAGEGKSIRRTSQSQRDETVSNPPSVARSGSSSVSSRKAPTSGAKVFNDDCHNADIMASPLAQKTTRTALGELPSTVTTERRGRESTATALDSSESDSTKVFADTDVYDFPQSSPTSSSRDSTSEEKGTKPKGSRQRSRKSFSVTTEDIQVENTTTHIEKVSSRHAASRKRASMAASTKNTRSEFGNAGESSTADSTPADGEKVSNNRRRSMML